MPNLQLGDRALTRNGDYKTIYAIDHHHTTRSTKFIQIWLSSWQNEAPLEVTEKHMVYLYGNREPVPASSIVIGDKLQTIQGPGVVTNINRVTRNGIYNPLTVDGTIVVSGGIIASSYSSLSVDSSTKVANVEVVSYQKFFDMVLKPYRFVCTQISLDICKTENERVFYSELGSQIYGYWLKQKYTFQSFLLLSFGLFFGFISLCLSPYGVFVFFMVGMRLSRGKINKKSEFIKLSESRS